MFYTSMKDERAILQPFHVEFAINWLLKWQFYPNCTITRELARFALVSLPSAL